MAFSLKQVQLPLKNKATKSSWFLQNLTNLHHVKAYESIIANMQSMHGLMQEF